MGSIEYPWDRHATAYAAAVARREQGAAQRGMENILPILLDLLGDVRDKATVTPRYRHGGQGPGVLPATCPHVPVADIRAPQGGRWSWPCRLARRGRGTRRVAPGRHDTPDDTPAAHPRRPSSAATGGGGPRGCGDGTITAPPPRGQGNRLVSAPAPSTVSRGVRPGTPPRHVGPRHAPPRRRVRPAPRPRGAPVRPPARGATGSRRPARAAGRAGPARASRPLTAPSAKAGGSNPARDEPLRHPGGRGVPLFRCGPPPPPRRLPPRSGRLRAGRRSGSGDLGRRRRSCRGDEGHERQEGATRARCAGVGGGGGRDTSQQRGTAPDRAGCNAALRPPPAMRQGRPPALPVTRRYSRPRR